MDLGIADPAGLLDGFKRRYVLAFFQTCRPALPYQQNPESLIGRSMVDDTDSDRNGVKSPS